MGNSTVLLIGVFTIFLAIGVIAPGINSAYAATLTTYNNDKTNFLSDSFAVDISGVYGTDYWTGSPIVLGDVTIDKSSGSIAVGTGSFPLSYPNGDWTALMSGKDIAIQGQEDLDITINTGTVSCFGFDFVEPTSINLGPGDAFIDSRFDITLKDGVGAVGTYLFEPDNDVATFTGVCSDVPFDKVEVREIIEATTTHRENEFYGHFYASVGLPPQSCTDVTIDFESYDADVGVEGLNAIHPDLDIQSPENYDTKVIEENAPGLPMSTAYNTNTNVNNGCLDGEKGIGPWNYFGYPDLAAATDRVSLDFTFNGKTTDSFSIDTFDYGDFNPKGGDMVLEMNGYDASNILIAHDEFTPTKSSIYDACDSDGKQTLQVSEPGISRIEIRATSGPDPGVGYDNLRFTICEDTLPPAEICEVNENSPTVYAASVEEYEPDYETTEQRFLDRQIPANAVGDVLYSGGSGTNIKFVSLFDGYIILEFTQSVGGKFTIWEATNGQTGWPTESALVEVSEFADGPWTEIGTATNDGAGTTPNRFTELTIPNNSPPVNFVKLTDITENRNTKAGPDFFDLDAVSALACDAGVPPTEITEISGMKFEDANADGLKTGDSGVENWEITLDCENDLLDAVTMTDIVGNYDFSFDLVVGDSTSCTLTENTDDTDWSNSTPISIGPFDVTAGDVITEQDFGNYQPVTISAYKFEDLNANGADDAEPALGGIGITLTYTDGMGAAFTDEQFTDVTGLVQWDGLKPGMNFVLTETTLGEFVASTDDIVELGNMQSGDSDDTAVFGNVKPIDAEKTWTHTDYNWDEICETVNEEEVCRPANINTDDVLADPLDVINDEFILLGNANKKGFQNTNPGAFFALTTVDVTVSVDSLTVDEIYDDCTVTKVDGLTVPMLQLLGSKQNIETALKAAIAAPNGDVTEISSKSIVIDMDDSHAIVEIKGPIDAGSKVFVLVKFSDALSGQDVTLPVSCTNEEVIGATIDNNLFETTVDAILTIQEKDTNTDINSNGNSNGNSKK